MSHAHLLLAVALALSGCAAQAASAPAHARPVDAASDALDVHFRALSTSLTQDGLTPAALLQRGFLPPSGRAAYPVTIAPGQCGMFLALATSSMIDLDAALYASDGAPLLEDDSASARPTLTLCAASEPIEAYFTLHAYQGAGSFVAAQFSRSARPDDDLRTSLGGDEPFGLSALGRLAQTLHERGFEDAAPRVQLAMLDARPVRLALSVTPGECYTLAAEGHDGLTEIALRLVDAEGGELANGIGEPSLAALQYCADTRAELSLEVSARRGQGIAQVARFRAAQALVGGARALWLGEPSPTPLAYRAKRVALASSAPFFEQSLPLRQGEVRELSPVRGRARCERWDAELEPGLSSALLRIENERGTLLAESDSDHMRACVIVCAPAGRRRVTLLGRVGFGRIKLRASVERAPAQGSAVVAASPCSD